MELIKKEHHHYVAANNDHLHRKSRLMRSNTPPLRGGSGSGGGNRRPMCITVSSFLLALLALHVFATQYRYNINGNTKLTDTTRQQQHQLTSHDGTSTMTIAQHTAKDQQQQSTASVQHAKPEKTKINDASEETVKEPTEETPTSTTTQENTDGSSTTALTWQRLVDMHNKKRKIHYNQQHQQKVQGGQGESEGDFATPQARQTCAQYVPTWILNLQASLEKKIYSQFGEDGITRYILQNVAPESLAYNNNNNNRSSTQKENNDKFYVEFGVQNGNECNTRFLRTHYNWTGLLMDGGFDNTTINLQREMIHPNNVVSLFKKYNVPKKFGLLSVDTDYADYYIWHNILHAGYRPRILISEFNSNFMGGGVSEEQQELLESESVTVHAPLTGQVRRWDGTDYYGVSALALKRLWNKYGYIMIYCTQKQVNCFGIHESDALLPALLQQVESNATTAAAAAAAAQECLWNKPLTWPKKIHPCNNKFESWSYVDKHGNLVANSIVYPLVVEHCRKHSIHRIRGDNVKSVIKVNGTIVGSLKA